MFPKDEKKKQKSCRDILTDRTTHKTAAIQLPTAPLKEVIDTNGIQDEKDREAVMGFATMRIDRFCLHALELKRQKKLNETVKRACKVLVNLLAEKIQKTKDVLTKDRLAVDEDDCYATLQKMRVKECLENIK